MSDNANETTIINTTKFKREGKIEVDGMTWMVKLPGAGTELKVSKAQRRIKLLDKKIEDGTAVEQDYDEYDRLEDFYLSFFKGIFTDSTPDNSEVNTWVDETPMAIIAAAFQDLTEQANSNES